METAFFIRSGKLNIPCKVCVPDGQPRRIVLGVHGLTGSKDDAIQAGIAEEMALFHAASYRFDLPGHGQNRDALTLENCVEALLAVAREAARQYPQVPDLCIFATGFGAYVTLIALQRLKALEKQLHLVIQTPAVLMHQTLLAMTGLSQETFRVMEQLIFPVEPPLTVTYRFFEELQRNIALTAHDLPMLILQGEADDYIRMTDIQRFRQLNEQARMVIIPGASHRFMEDGAWDMVLDLTRDWFEYQQVLLADYE